MIINLTAVHLLSCPAVHRNSACSGFLCKKSHFNSVDVVIIPAFADFDRNGNVHRFNNRLCNFVCKLRFLHQACPSAVHGNFRSRAAHIYVEYIRLVFEAFDCRLSHNFRVVTENLCTARSLGAYCKQFSAFFVAHCQTF